MAKPDSGGVWVAFNRGSPVAANIIGARVPCGDQLVVHDLKKFALLCLNLLCAANRLISPPTTSSTNAPWEQIRSSPNGYHSVAGRAVYPLHRRPRNVNPDLCCPNKKKPLPGPQNDRCMTPCPWPRVRTIRSASNLGQSANSLRLLGSAPNAPRYDDQPVRVMSVLSMPSRLTVIIFVLRDWPGSVDHMCAAYERGGLHARPNHPTVSAPR